MEHISELLQDPGFQQIVMLILTAVLGTAAVKRGKGMKNKRNKRNKKGKKND